MNEFDVLLPSKLLLQLQTCQVDLW